MNESVDIEVLRDEALRKLGRNIVNFAKIEAAFKYLLSVSQLEGTEKTISDQLGKNQTRLEKKTLGNLVWNLRKIFWEMLINLSLNQTFLGQKFLSHLRLLMTSRFLRNTKTHTC
jgi:hypothetical protein